MGTKYTTPNGIELESTKPGIRLSGREVEILSLIAQGFGTRDVADQLFVSKRTIDYHLANVYIKLDVCNRVQAILRACRLGLIPIEPVLHAADRTRDTNGRELVFNSREPSESTYQRAGAYAVRSR